MATRQQIRDERREAILRVVQDTPIFSQEQLVEALTAFGFSITQGTLSRDLNALGISKVPNGAGGSVYQVLESTGTNPSPDQLRRDFTSQLLRCKAAGQMVLLFTSPGGAGVLGRIIDELGWEDVEGTLAGDDTVLVVARSPQIARQLRDRIVDWAGI